MDNNPDQLADMSQASVSHTQSRRSLPSRLSLRTNMLERMGLHERLGSWGGQPNSHRNKDSEERHSATHLQVNLITLTMRTVKKVAPLLTLEEPILVAKLLEIPRKLNPPTPRLGSIAKKVDPCEPTRKSINVAQIVKVINAIDQLSKNKSGSKWGVIPRIGVLNRDVEIFRRGVIALGTTRCQRVWRRVGSRVGTTVSPRMISQSSRARRISRILIRITFEPRTDLA
ncbi:unnamed protein product [Prunus armeniaca]